MFWSHVHPSERPEALREDWSDEEDEAEGFEEAANSLDPNSDSDLADSDTDSSGTEQEESSMEDSEADSEVDWEYS